MRAKRYYERFVLTLLLPILILSAGLITPAVSIAGEDQIAVSDKEGDKRLSTLDWLKL